MLSCRGLPKSIVVTSFDVIEQVGVDNIPHIGFVTAFDEYALRAFEVHALDYLLKPSNRERFQKTLIPSSSFTFIANLQHVKRIRPGFKRSLVLPSFIPLSRIMINLFSRTAWRSVCDKARLGIFLSGLMRKFLFLLSGSALIMIFLTSMLNPVVMR